MDDNRATGHITLHCLIWHRLFEKQAVVEWKKQDRYGRTVGKVLVNGIDANLAQVKAGMAW